MTTRTVTLNDGELAATVAALHAYRSETQHYLRSYGPDTTHDDCCPKAQAREALRVERRAALEKRLREIDGALVELDR